MKGPRILAAGNDEHAELLKGRVSKAKGIVKRFRREGRIIHYRMGHYPHLATLGKTLRATSSQPHPVHRLNCYEVATGIVLWHGHVQEKENE